MVFSTTLREATALFTGLGLQTMLRLRQFRLGALSTVRLLQESLMSRSWRLRATTSASHELSSWLMATCNALTSAHRIPATGEFPAHRTNATKFRRGHLI